MYDPLGGRFLSSDPIMQAPFWSQGLNPYSYVFNDPINMTDPSGYSALSDFGKGLSAVWLPGMMMLSGAGGGIVGAAIGGGYAGLGIARAGTGMYNPTYQFGGGEVPHGLRMCDTGMCTAQNAGDPGGTGTTGTGNLSSDVPAQVTPEEAQAVGGEIAMGMVPGGPIVRAIIWAEKLARAGNWVRRAGQAVKGLWGAKAAAKAAPKIPFEGFQEWGRPLWGKSVEGAQQALEKMTPEVAKTIDPTKARQALEFYKQAGASGRGGDAATARVRLMERILQLQK
jgi:hypothetical protein